MRAARRYTYQLKTAPVIFYSYNVLPVLKNMTAAVQNPCMNVYHLPEEEQKLLRKGLNNGQKIFNKSRRSLKHNKA
jgi:hypothetical protein